MNGKKTNKPNYRRLYLDIIEMKYPGKKEQCSAILHKKELEILDIIQLNKIIFGYKEHNQKYKSYDKSTIHKILEYQRQNSCSNTHLANTFKISRNTITKWKKIKL